MPLSEEQLFGQAAAAKKKRKEDTGFITSALAGVYTGLWNIPKGLVSLGAELVDLGLGTESAAGVEKWFDDLNPFDDEAEARTIGRITQALAQIGPVAIKGAMLGIKAGKMAQTALAAKKTGSYASLGKYGAIVAQGGEKVARKLVGPTSGAIIGSGVGEALVSDEDIGTLGDMLRGTSLEPYAITMMNTEDKEGRAEAFRRLTNRLKFGTEGALFNLGITGAAKGIKTLRKPVKFGVDEYADSWLGEAYQKYFKFGLKKGGMGTEAMFEAKRLGLDQAAAIKFDAGLQVGKFDKALKEIWPRVQDNYLLAKNIDSDAAQKLFLDDIQDILQPYPGRKIKGEVTPQKTEAASGIKNNARDKFKLTDTGDLAKIEASGGFDVTDYSVTSGGKFDKILQKIQTAGGDPKDFKEAVLNFRATVDNMSLKLLRKNLPDEMAQTMRQQMGNYLTAEYKQFNQMPFFGHKVTNEMKTKALRSFTLQAENAHRLSEAKRLKISPDQVVVPQKIKDEALEKGAVKIDRFLKAKSIDEVDPGIKNIKDQLTGEPPRTTPAEKKLAKLEDDAIKLDTSIIKSKKLDEWQEILAGRIRDPRYTFLSSVSKMAGLNYTLDYMDDIARMGSKAGEGKFIFNDAQDLVKSGRAIDLEDAVTLLDDPKKYKQVKSTGVDGLSPLDGKYIKAPIYDELFETATTFLNTNKAGMVYKYAMLGPKAISQITKTVLSPVTHARNFLSAGAFAAANGAILPSGQDFRSLLPKNLGGKVFETAKTGEGLMETARRLTVKRLRGTMTREDVDLYQRLLRTGMVQTQVHVGEMKRLGMDFYPNVFADPNSGTKAFRGTLNAGKKAKWLYGKVQDAYVAEDDYWKVITWGLERNRYEKLLANAGIDQSNFQKLLKETSEMGNFLNNGVKRNHNALTRTYNGNYDQFLDEFAANLARNQVPNYAYVGRAGRALRLSPFGNFIAFPMEIFRTGHNVIEQGIKEYTNKLPGQIGQELSKLGGRRLASFGLTVGAVPLMVQETAKAIHNASSEEMEALRRVVPEWSRNSVLIPRGRDKDGYLKYTDFSYSNAYDVLLRPVRAVYNSIAEGKDDESSLKASLGAGLQNGVAEFMEPFASESMFTQALVDSVIRAPGTGIGKGGKRIWSQGDETFVKLTKGVGHLAKAFQPGSWSQMKRLKYAVMGEGDPDYGKTFDIMDEAWGLAGFRAVQSDPERALIYKTSRFNANLKKADNLFTTPLIKGGRVSPQDVLGRYQYSEARRFYFLKEMTRDIDAMKKLGMSSSKIRKELSKRRGLSKDIIRDLMIGTYTPKRPSDFFVRRMAEINRDLNQKEGENIPNPYRVALPSINRIIRKNRRIDLLNDNVNFSQLAAEGMAKGGRVSMQEGGEAEAGDKELAASIWVTEPEPVKQAFEYDFEKYYASGVWMEKAQAAEQPQAAPQAAPPTPPVNANAIKDPMVDANVMNTGLTPTETALLSEEEKGIRLRQRGIARA